MYGWELCIGLACGVCEPAAVVVSAVAHSPHLVVLACSVGGVCWEHCMLRWAMSSHKCYPSIPLHAWRSA